MAKVGGMLASAVLVLALKKISAAIEGQITLQWNFTKDLRKMKMTLESLAAVLEDAERQSIESRAVQLWLKRLQDAMYRISDMLEEFEIDTNPAAQQMSLKKHLVQLTSIITSCLAIDPRVILANRMKGIRKELKEISDQHENFSLKAGHTTNELKTPDTRETSSFMADEELIVGRTNDKRHIMASLSEGIAGRRTTIFLPIYGIGGIGKTTLAKMVFNDTHFKDYSHVWVYVSQMFYLNKIGNSIISQLSKQQSHLTERQMIQNSLVELLSGKNILLVLDDLWEDNGSHLDDLKDMLKVGKDSRIVVIVTTRNQGVAKKFHSIEPYKLAPLSNDSCWIIIKQKSDFESRDDKQQVEQIGKDIAAKCGGVALAAQSLGHMLNQLTSDQWESVRNSNVWNVSASEDTGSVLSSLRLTYSCMPSHLKLCFAYCAIFPKGHKIVKHDLIHQWNSLGFIMESDIFSSEQLGEKYISQLLGLSFLEPSRSHNSDTGVHHEDVTHLTMHDLVLDLARFVLVDELILGVSKQGNTEASSCRYALFDDCSKKLELYTDFPAKIRALRYIDCGKIGLQGDAFSSAKYLRVLDLSDCFIQKLPDSVGELKQLRYLNAPRVQHQMTPNCITKLFKLIYLSLSGSSALSVLPDSIGEMEGLMYLDLSGCSGLENLPDSLDKLKQLVHLDFSNCSNLTGVSKSLQSLTNLEYLNLSYCWNITELPEHFGSILKLKYLNISGCVEIQELPNSFGSLKYLMHLDLSHCSGLHVMPEMLGNLTKLQYLNLSHCGCIGQNRAAEALGNLTELRRLYLSGIVDTICQDESTFNNFLEHISTLSNLEYLDLSCTEGLFCLPECIVRLGKLSTLDISDCSSLLSVPECIVQMDSLKTLYTKNCSSFVNQFAGAGHELKKGLTAQPKVVVDFLDIKGSNHVMFMAVNATKLKICGLEKVKFVEEVQSIKLVGEQGIKQLELEWGVIFERGAEEDNKVLGCLIPPSSIETLGIYGYNSLMFPDWLMGIPSYNFPNLVSISLSGLAHCTSLPPLGQLPKLKKLDLGFMQRVTKIDEDLCGVAVAFPQLESFTLQCMLNLETWNTMYSYRGDSGSRYMFPCLRKLEIDSCPKLRLKPCPPKAEEWAIIASDGVITSWGQSRSHATASTSSSPLVTTLKVQYCNVPMHQWRLLCHLPGLANLTIDSCSGLTSSPEIEKLTMGSFQVDGLQEVAKHLTSLVSLQLLGCHIMTALPLRVGDLISLERLSISYCVKLNNLQEIIGCSTSLKILDIKYCKSIETLPDSIQQLTGLEKLQIFRCSSLEQWCESEENKMKLAHITVIKEDWN